MSAATPTSPLEAYRDDGPLGDLARPPVGARLRLGEDAATLAGMVPVALVLAVAAPIASSTGAAAAGLALGRRPARPSARTTSGAGRLAWLVPALLRVAEFGGL